MPRAGKQLVSVLPESSPWAFAAPIGEAQAKPLPVVLAGLPLVLWRPKGQAWVALLDRCPHRRVPLSLGQVQGDRLVCAYHGWAFGPDGACVAQPAEAKPAWPARPLPSFPVAIAQGALWVALAAGAAEAWPSGALGPPPSAAAGASWVAVGLGEAPESLAKRLEVALPGWAREGSLWRSPSGLLLLALSPVAPWASLLGLAQAPGAPADEVASLQRLREALGPAWAGAAWPPPPPQAPPEGWGSAWCLGWPPPTALLGQGPSSNLAGEPASCP